MDAGGGGSGNDAAGRGGGAVGAVEMNTVPVLLDSVAGFVVIGIIIIRCC